MIASVALTGGADAPAVIAEEAAEETAGGALKNAAIQMGIGAVTTGAGNAMEAAENHESGMQILEAAGAGAVTGALANTPIGKTLTSFALGGGAGALNGYLTQGIASPSAWTHPDMKGIEQDGMLGGFDNLLGTGIANWGGPARNGTTWGNLISGVASTAASGVCGLTDKVKLTDC
jgi:hypothetical protein